MYGKVFGDLVWSHGWWVPLCVWFSMQFCCMVWVLIWLGRDVLCVSINILFDLLVFFGLLLLVFAFVLYLVFHFHFSIKVERQ